MCSSGESLKEPSTRCDIKNHLSRFILFLLHDARIQSNPLNFMQQVAGTKVFACNRNFSVRTGMSNKRKLSLQVVAATGRCSMSLQSVPLCALTL